MKRDERNKKSKESRQWFEAVRKTISVKMRKNSVGSWYLPATKTGYRWFVRMPSVFKDEIGFNVSVQKRYQATKTTTDFKPVKTYNVNALSLPAMLSENPETYI